MRFLPLDYLMASYTNVCAPPLTSTHMFLADLTTFTDVRVR